MKKTGKRALSLLVSIVLLLTMLPRLQLPAVAEGDAAPEENPTSGTCGEHVSWTLSGGTLTITGTGPMPGYSSASDAPWYEQRASIQSLYVAPGITAIGNKAFCYFNNLTWVSIPDTVTRIGTHVFYNCTGLTTVAIPKSVTAIGGHAFYGCSNLTMVTFLGSAPTFANTCFTKVTAAVYYPCNNKTWTSNAQQNYGGKLTWKILHSYVDGVCSGCEVKTLTDGSCGDQLWWVLNNFGTLTISGTGAMTNFANTSDVPWYSYRNRIKTVVIGDGVTTIGDKAFYNCNSLKAVTVGQNVTTLGNQVFTNCFALEMLTLPAGVTTLQSNVFSNCNALRALRFQGDAPALQSDSLASTITVEYYEGSSGYDVSPWTDLTCRILHPGTWVTTIAPTCTTAGTRELKCTYCQETFTESFELGHQFVNDVCLLCQYAKIYYSGSCGYKLVWQLDAAGTLTISGSGRMNGYDMEDEDFIGLGEVMPWYDITWKIKKVVFLDGVTSVGRCAFYKCGNLETVILPDSIEKINSYAFYCCKKLTNVNIPEGVTEIGEHAFSSCYGLKTISIPDSVTEIGRYAFSGCYNMKTLKLSNSLTSLSQGVFQICGILEVTIPERVTQIGMSAFDSCSELTSVTIPEGVTSIGYSAFDTCRRLTSIRIPASVTKIDDYAFSGCENLTSITFRGTKPYIGSSCFWNVTANASYPCGDEQWKKTNMSVYGGDITLTEVHMWEETITGPTCVQDKVKTKTCSVCGFAQATVISGTATGHTNQIMPGQAATCTQPGLTEGVKCAVCDEVLLAQQTISMMSHDCEITHVPVSCTGYGYDHYRCKYCDDSYYKNPVPPTGHHYEAVVTAPTCTGEGFTTCTCSGCGDAYTIDRTAPTDHRYERGVCVLCGEALPVGIVGDLNGDGERTIADVARLYAHTQGTLLLDSVSMAYADVTGDGDVDIADTARLYAHIQGTNPFI